MKQFTVGHLLRGEPGNQEMLMGTRTGDFCPGIIAAPGGKCFPNEDPLVCVARELEEEIGVKIHQPSTRHCATVFYTCPVESGEIANRTVHFFNIVRWEGEPQLIEGFSDVKWFPVNDLPYHLMHADVRYWLPIALKMVNKVLLVDMTYADVELTIVTHSQFRFAG